MTSPSFRRGLPLFLHVTLVAEERFAKALPRFLQIIPTRFGELSFTFGLIVAEDRHQDDRPATATRFVYLLRVRRYAMLGEERYALTERGMRESTRPSLAEGDFPAVEKK